MRTSRAFFHWFYCWLCLLGCSQSLGYTVVRFTGSGSTGKPFAGASFNDAVSRKSGGQERPTYYGSNYATGFKCPHDKPYEVDPMDLHADSQAGYLFLLGGSLHAKVSSSWQPPFTTANTTFHMCRWCRFGNPELLGWSQMAFEVVNCETNVMPAWVFDSPYVQNVSLETSDSQVIGGSFDLSAPWGGIEGETGDWNDYDMNVAPVWEWYEGYDPEGGGSSSSNTVAASAWTLPRVNTLLNGVNTLGERSNMILESSLESSETLNSIYSQYQDYMQSTFAHRNLVEEFMASQNQTRLEGVFESVGDGITLGVSDLRYDVNYGFAGLEEAIMAASSPPVDLSPVVDLLSPLVNADVPASVGSDFVAPVLGGHVDGFLSGDLGELGGEIDAGLGWFEGVGSYVSGVGNSLIGSWVGVGRTAPAAIVNVTFPIIGVVRVDYQPEVYGSFVEFGRAVMAVALWLSCLFACGRLVGSLFGGE